MAGLVGTKVGMTRVIGENGSITPVTLVNLQTDNVVLKVMGKEGKQRVEVGAMPYKKERKNKKYRCVASFPMTEGETYQVGAALGLSLFQEGDKLTVRGVSKGKGFQGPVKRYHFHGLPATHGHPKSRVPGAIGCRSTPGRVYKNLRMAGRMGNDWVTKKNVEVVRIDDENKLVALKGALPGAIGSKVIMTITKKAVAAQE